MTRLYAMWRTVRLWAIVIGTWTALQAHALAQQGGGAKGPEEVESPPYVVPYALVILLVALGLLVVLNSSKRRERAKPEVYGESSG